MVRYVPSPLPSLLASALALSLVSGPAPAQTGLVTRGPLVLDSRWNDEPFAEVAAGRWHTLARRADGSVVGWGESSIGECQVPTPPAGIDYVQVAAGGSWICPWDCIYLGFSAALRGDGTVVVWGSNEFGEHDVPALPAGVKYVGVSAGTHLLALRDDGQLVAWGDGSSGQTAVPALPSGLAFEEAAAGSFFSLARRSDGSVMGWGENGQGQCDVPALPAGVKYVEIAAGWRHGVALRSDGSVVAWGDNSSGQCNVPALPPGLAYLQVAAGWRHTAALRSDGSVVAWGLNAWGQCDVPAPPIGRHYVEVAASETHTVARLDDGTVVAFGSNDRGQLNVPELPAGIDHVQVAGGGAIPNNSSVGFQHHALALSSDGSVDAWGYDFSGECDVPPLPAGLAYVEVGAGWGYSAALRSDGSFVRWGLSYGIPAVITPPPGLGFVELAAGAQHCLRLNVAGKVSASGSNYWGQCNVPALSAGLSYVEIAAGLGHSMARRSDGSIAAWGLNDLGQCDVPAAPVGLTYVEVAAGWNHSLARLSDGSVVAWGDNALGQLDVPAPPPGLTYAGIEANAHHSVGRLSDGSVVIWGDLSNGQGSLPAPPSGQIYTGLAAGPGLTGAILQNGASGVSYCTSSENSTGCAATIGASGDASLAANDLTLRATCVPDGVFLFFHGPRQNLLPFGNGTLCVGGGLVRILPAGLASGGVAQVLVDLPSAGITSPGLRNFQCWFRDPSAGGAGSDTSDAIAITFVP